MMPRRFFAWCLLAAASAGCTLLLRALAVPGAVLLGPMLVAIGFAVSGAQLKLNPAALLGVQSVLGCMVASVVSADLLRLVASHWMVILAINVLSILAASAISLLITRRGWLPGQSAIWGLSPGAASTMMMLGEARGEDPRLIALMQNLRIVMVTLTAIAIAGIAGAGRAAVSMPASIFSSGPVSLFAMTVLLALVMVGIATAKLAKWPQAAFWIPAIAGSGLQVAQLTRLEIPAMVAAVAFGIGGCYAGLRFNRQALLSCFRLMPAMLAGIGMMIALCIALMGLIHHSFAGVSALTAFLAVMPGGIDAAVAIANGMQASVPVIIAVQVARLVVVTLLAPPLAQLMARYDSSSASVPRR